MIRLLAKLILINILFETKRKGIAFKIGNYSHLKIPDLNSIDCGLSLVPIVYELHFEGNNLCFIKRYQNKTIFEFHKNSNKHNPRQRVYSGENTEFGEASFAAHIRPKRLREKLKWTDTDNKWETKTCTAVLITLEWVLTAAHCFQSWMGSPGSGIDVYAGTKVRRGNEPHVMSRFIAHPIFIDPKLPNTTLTNKQLLYRQRNHDIALIKLKQQFHKVFTEDNTYLLNPICLPERADLNTTDLGEVKYFGYGAIDSNSQPPRALQKGYIKLMERCEEHSFCGQYIPNGPQICKGDSGGPLIQYLDKKEFRTLLIGIISTSIPPIGRETSLCGSDFGLQFIALPYHVDWILETMKNNT